MDWPFHNHLIKKIVLKNIVSYEPKPSIFTFDIDNLLTSNFLVFLTPPIRQFKCVKFSHQILIHLSLTNQDIKCSHQIFHKFYRFGLANFKV